ncbi:E3 ubiquitin-protein ligase TRAF7 [Patella vulgata]|uniref:E3 ubiquitin-protein ligase TRAF7 n=1 Tax=Patella vulgata TaxID=6465 RepID=UPI00217F7A05|nr:E3 ubiquitin-protein ligase TRAF7 [Patella vulgata]
MSLPDRDRDRNFHMQADSLPLPPSGSPLRNASLPTPIPPPPPYHVETTFGTSNFPPVTTVKHNDDSDGEYYNYLSSNASTPPGTLAKRVTNGLAEHNHLPKISSLLQIPSPVTQRHNSVSSNRSSLVPDSKEDLILVFVDPPNKTLLCKLCNKIFRDPVIVSCGHTYCRRCVQLNTESLCPVDNDKLSIVVANIAVFEQTGELLIHCRYGCRLSEDGETYKLDEALCPVTMKMLNRNEHENDCDYKPVECPNRAGCPKLLKKDLEDHLRSCNNVRCSNKKYGCDFVGTQEELEDHLKHCKYESMKEFLQRSDEKMSDMQLTVLQKDQEIEFLRSMLGKLAERLEMLEKSVDIKLELVEHNQSKIMNEVMDNRREYGTLADQLALMNNRLDLGATAGAYDPISIFKCKGTCVGHQGPVWCLCAMGDHLYSGSSDKTVKVWDTSANFQCVKTLEGHTGIVLALCTHGKKLFSGSQDCNILVWDTDSFETIKCIQAHDNPVCTLTTARNMVFSGSLKVIRVWDVYTYEMKHEITGLNHWVRALSATAEYLFSGSYQTIKIWDLTTLECVRMLETSGGSVYSIAITHHHILCGTYENCINVWELSTYKQTTTLMGHSGTIYALAALHTASGTKVFSASYDRSLRVWSMDNLICTQTLVRHTGSVACLAVSRGRIFSGAVDSTVKVWQ